MRAHRASLLSNNIANADTPGYKARDIDFSQVLQQQASGRNHPSQMRGSDPRHFSQTTENLDSVKLYRTPLMPSLDGNTVDVQLEQSEFAQNNIQFLASLRFLNGKIQGMRSAISGE